MKSYETIEVDKKDGITTVRFNRPDKRNCMNPTMHREMFHVLSELEYDAETRVLVITGNGEAFCAGQDLKEYFYKNKDNPRERDEIRKMSHAWRHQKLYYFPKPTIAMVNGWCFGGAFTVVGSCDIAIAADEATFGLSEINFGQIPGGLVAKVISGLMPARKALYYGMTAETFDGKKAAEMDFVTLSVPKAELAEKTLAVAEVLKSKDVHGMKATKEAFKAVDLRSMSFEDAWYWLLARERQNTFDQKDNSWIEKGIGEFMKGTYRPGLEAQPTSKS